MKKILLFLLVFIFVGCTDNSIDRFQSNGVSRTYGYGEFMELCQECSFEVTDKAKLHENLTATIYYSGRYYHYSITIPAYYYVLRVEPCGSMKYNCCDVYVPEDFYNRYQKGDTIWQIK